MISLTDEYTVALGVTAIATYVVSRFLIPPSLVHPLLLGRQAHVAQVRKEGESAVYTNYGAANSSLPIAPGRGVTTQVSLLKLDSANAHVERWLWDRKISNAQLSAKAATVGAALCTIAGLVPKASRVLLLLDDGFEWLVADLALASHCIPSVTISSATLLHATIDSHPPDAIIVQAPFLEQLLEVLEESDHPHTHSTTLIVVGDRTGEVKKHAGKVRTKIVTWEDVETFKAEGVTSTPPIAGDISSAHFYANENGVLRGAQFTHQNVVAGTTATINIFPTSQPWSESDSVVSAHSLSTPYGRSILYAALYTGSHFTTLPSSCTLSHGANAPTVGEIVRAASHEGRPAPTLMFLTSKHLSLLTTSILNFAKKSFLFRLAWQHKHSGILQGYLVRDGLWDRWVFMAARKQAVGNGIDKLRAVCIGGEPSDAAAIVPARIALSVPIVAAYPSPLSTGPVFASHPLDLQVLDPGSGSGEADSSPSKTHTGAPTCNIEIKLLHIAEEAVNGGADPEGELCIRGPGVGDPVPMGVQLEDGWIDAGVNARVRANGTFVIGKQRTRLDGSSHDFTLI
ncbi:hypothetical protein M408DRAFT_329011 [Serendipita vermifera MAFF 305830]|uniref:AMP-dependent synthetase/ligase domain-containing protein n=1 Tax=Serendipita vermifera MAFF 305830 TaxID=933852 RepID=A0A0C3BA09_SERVB|nr:hypothetical protein M408DRAFT_329011 [Serendipita vermifera MAFF 305830]